MPSANDLRQLYAQRAANAPGTGTVLRRLASTEPAQSRARRSQAALGQRPWPPMLAIASLIVVIAVTSVVLLTGAERSRSIAPATGTPATAPASVTPTTLSSVHTAAPTPSGTSDASPTGSSTASTAEQSVPSDTAAAPAPRAPFRLPASSGFKPVRVDATTQGYGVSVIFAADPADPADAGFVISGESPCTGPSSEATATIDERLITEKTIGGAVYCLIVQEDVTTLQRKDPAGAGPYPLAVTDLTLSRSLDELASLLSAVELAPDPADPATWFDLT